MIRIIGGIAKGRQLKIPPGKVRPATARTRKSIFDSLSGFVQGANILDLYCGSGGLGLEALSRGAVEAWFIDLSARSIDVARENAKSIGMIDQAHFICKDVFRFLNRFSDSTINKFDLIFAAPPYRIAEPDKLLKSIAVANIIESEGVICLEYSRHTPFPSSQEFHLEKRKVYGETVVDMWAIGK